MDIITLDEEYCSECNSYIGLIGLVGSGLCPRCQREISALEEEDFDDAFGFDVVPEPAPTLQEEQEALNELQVTDPETYKYIKHAEYDPEPSDDDATEDELHHTELSPLALPKHEKPRRAKKSEESPHADH